MLIALVLAGPAESGVHYVSTAAQFNATVEKIGNRSGTVVLKGGRYGTLRVGQRSPTARWLTVRAQHGALTKHVELRGARRVNLLDLRMRPYRGGHALLLVRWSRQVNVAGLTLQGTARRMARVRVRYSRGVVVRDSDLARCVVICFRADNSAAVMVAGNAFHDCFGCDFLVAKYVRGMAWAPAPPGCPPADRGLCQIGAGDFQLTGAGAAAFGPLSFCGERGRATVGTELRCEECGQIADAEMKGWRALLGVDPDDECRGLTANVFCPECAEREFGPPRNSD